jgi:hypothetical protein
MHLRVGKILEIGFTSLAREEDVVLRNPELFFSFRKC